MPQVNPRQTLVPASAIETLKSAPLGKLTPRIISQSEWVDVAFFDTFDAHILSKGQILVQQAKTLHLIGAGANLEQKCSEIPTFVASLPDGPVKENLGMVPALRSLIPLGRAKMEYTALAYVDDEAKTHVRLELQIFKHDSGSSLCVANPVGLRGYDKALLGVNSWIENLSEKQPDWSSFYKVLLPNWQSYDAKPQISLPPQTAAFDMANAIIAAHIPMMRQNEAGVISDIDTEFLHDYRIALRKIRSVVSLFAGVYDSKQTIDLKSEFSALMAPTGKLRDLDVYLLTRDEYYALLPTDLHPGLERMFDLFAAQRAEAQSSLAKRLQSTSYRVQVKRLGKLFSKGTKLDAGPKADAPAHDFACNLIWKRYRKICKIASGITEETPDEEVHNLRIQCKKLRYLMEMFAPVFPKQAIKELIRPLKQLQDNLGLFNDYCVQQESLREFLANLNSETPKENVAIAQTVGALIALMHQRQLAERAKVVKSFAAFNSSKTQTSFHALFQSRKEPA